MHHFWSFLMPILTVVLSTTLVAWLLDLRGAKRSLGHYLGVAVGGLLLSSVVLIALLPLVTRHSYIRA